MGRNGVAHLFSGKHGFGVAVPTTAHKAFFVSLFVFSALLCAGVYAANATALRTVGVRTCTGSGQMLLYQGDQFQPLATSFSTQYDQLVIFTRGDYIFSPTVKRNGAQSNPSLLADIVSPFHVKVWEVGTVPGDLVEISGNSTYGARSIGGYALQNSASPLYSASNLTVGVVISGSRTDSAYLPPGQYSYVVFDVHSLENDGHASTRAVNVSVDSPAGNIASKSYPKPFPAGTEGAVIDSFGISSGGTYSIRFGGNESIYFPVMKCPSASSPAPPIVVISSPVQDAVYNTSTVDLNYTVSGDSPPFSCWYALDAGAAVPLPSCAGTPLAGLSNGGHSVTVYANDTNGNAGSDSVQFSVGAGAVSLCSCGSLSSNTAYALECDIIDYPSDVDCFVAYQQQNISFDCQGHIVDGTDIAWYSRAFFLSQSSNVTVKNCVLTDFGRGMQLDRSSYNSIRNITARSNVDYGIKLFPTSLHNTISRISASENNIGIGIYNNFDGSTDSGSNYNAFSDIAASGNRQSGVNIYYSIGNSFTSLDIADSNNAISLQSSSQNSFSGGSLASNSNSGVMLTEGSNSNSFSGITASSNNWGVYLDNSNLNSFTSFSNEIGRVPNGLFSMYRSNSAQDISSRLNTGWFPLCSQDGSAANAQAGTAWYNGTAGGRNADGSANPGLHYWFGECGNASPDYSVIRVRPERLVNSMGQNFTIEVRVKNIGSQGVASTSTTTQLSGNCALQNRPAPPLPINGEFIDTFSCACSVPGRNSFTVKADAFNNLVETNENNNEAAGVFWCGASSVPACSDYV